MSQNLSYAAVVIGSIRYTIIKHQHLSFSSISRNEKKVFIAGIVAGTNILVFIPAPVSHTILILLYEQAHSNSILWASWKISYYMIAFLNMENAVTFYK